MGASVLVWGGSTWLSRQLTGNVVLRLHKTLLRNQISGRGVGMGGGGYAIFSMIGRAADLRRGGGHQEGGVHVLKSGGYM